MQSDEPLTICPMTSADLEAVAEVERAAYAVGWPATAFENEIQNNRLSRYVVLRRGDEVVGFGGLWLLVDQAHIVTVAVKPGARRQGYGRMIVHALIEIAIDAHMDSATLECRVSNEAARALYRHYGFYEVGERKRYYADNGEDAVIMTTEALASPAYASRLDRLRRELPAEPASPSDASESAVEA